MKNEPDASFAVCNPQRHAKSWGIFKETYKGEGIYWSGTYNVEGQGSHKTVQDARDVIDSWLKARAENELKEKQDEIAAGAIKAVRAGDNVTVYFPDGPSTMPMWRYRQFVWSFEEKYGEIVFVPA